MTGMRRLASLYTDFQKIWNDKQQEESCSAPQIRDMFKRRNFAVLEVAIDKNSTDEEGKIKPGLKIALAYILKTAGKIIKASLLMEDKDEEASEIDKFVDVLNLNNNYIFGDAQYLLNKGRQIKLRKPDTLPQETDVQMVRTYTIQTVQNLLNDEYLHWTAHEFIQLRDLVACRLTLFNARRGGEPSRLHLRELHEADAEAWIEKRHMHQLQDPAEKALLKNTKIAYQSGKGTKRLVSILIPSDMVEAMRKLTDQELRKQGSKIPLALSPNANEKFALARIKFQQVDIWRIKLHKFQL